MKGTDGNTNTLNSFSEANVLVIIFNANHCPTAQAYEDRIIAVSRDYKANEVEVMLISSNNNQALSLFRQERIIVA